MPKMPILVKGRDQLVEMTNAIIVKKNRLILIKKFFIGKINSKH